MATRKDLFGCPGESPWLGRRIKLKTYVSSSPFNYASVVAAKTLSLQRLMKLGNIVWVETSRYLTKIMILWRKAARSKVLAAKHTASLQLLRTVGGNQAKLNARSEFESRQRGGGSWSCNRLYYGFRRYCESQN